MPGLNRSVWVLMLICAGCATQPRSSSEPSRSSRPAQSAPSAAQPPVNLSGYSPAFKQGYTEGCASARGATRRDDARYRSDTDYMMGWSDGYSVCQSR